jgi:kynurenine formamidase
MKSVVFICFSIILVFMTSCTRQPDFTQGEWIDLSHEFSAETIYWPTADGFKHDTVFAGITPKGYYYTAFNFAAAEHGGTHIDAPIHFAKGRKSVDELEITQLIAPAIVIDVSTTALDHRDYQIGQKDFENWEEQYGRLPDNCIVLLYTGYQRFWPDRVKYLGTDKFGQEGVAELHFPGLDPAASQWLIDNRKIKAIGLDTPSIDFGQSQFFKSHQILFDKNIPVFENVTNLDQLPVTGATVFAFPMKIKGGSGGPLRIAAWLPE